MGELTDPERAELHGALLRMQAELVATRATTEGLAGTVHLDQSAVGRVSRGDALQAQAMAAEQVRRNAFRLKQVAVALAAVEDGSYGDCRVCGEPNQVDYGPFRACAADRSALRFALTSTVGPTDVPGRSEEHAVCPLLAVRRIGFARLSARPETPACVPCMAELERG